MSCHNGVCEQTLLLRKPLPCNTAAEGATVGFHNFNLRIFNLRVSNPDKLIVDLFDTMSDFNVPGSGPKKSMKFRKSTAQQQKVLHSP